MAENKKKKSTDKMPWEMTDEELRNAMVEPTNEDETVIDIGNKMPWELTDEEIQKLQFKPARKDEPTEPETFEDVDTSTFDDEAGSGVRFEASGMDTTKDRQKVLEKYYDNVRPINGGDNFVMTDRETGKDIVLNKESWMPTVSDFAGYAPDLTGGVLGGVLGMLGGGAGGTVVGGPVGTVGGAVAGGAAGYAGGKNVLQKGINTLYGNEDTQDTGDYLKGVAIDAAIGGGGELGGYAIKPIAAGGKYLFNKAITKPAGEVLDVAVGAKPVASKSVYGVPDAPDAIAENMSVFKDATIDPTIGMVGGRNMATKELNNATKNPEVGRVIQNVYDTIDDKVGQNIDVLGSGAQKSVAETGATIKQGVSDFKDQLVQRNNQLYGEVGQATNGINAGGKAINEFADKLKNEFNSLPEITKKNYGSVYQNVFDDLGALGKDIGDGIGFDTIKETRTFLGSKLGDRSLSAAEKNIYNRYYSALTDEMRDIATQAGDEILTKWTKANNSTRRLYDPNGTASYKLMDKIVEGTDEAAYKLILDGSKKNTNQARQIFNLVKAGAGQQGVGDVQSSILSKIGSKNGVFDVNTFARNFETLTPEAKKLFGQGEGVSSVPGSLDKLSKAINYMANNYGKRQNFSNTAAHMDAGRSGVIRSMGTKAGMGVLSGGYSLAFDALEIGINRFLKANPKQMTNPKFINTLSYVAEAKTPSGISKRISQAIAGTKDETIKLQLRELGDEISRSNTNK
ncbi:hypothetical protein G6M86_20940 [Agrobacterium tumefaciens]|uniref:Uncharacterized protein n=1 Tax=Agrobacterium tumefaciens TaxID=358 RepID=A0AAJ4N6W5_AGRTU|nr:hypothetical protein G6M86_20940 [Agrobacterium tumefaciens]